ncbi:MAG: hypothetical protein AB7R55_01005 [Gemmatimonadales bacterium]
MLTVLRRAGIGQVLLAALIATLAPASPAGEGHCAANQAVGSGIEHQRSHHQSPTERPASGHEACPHCPPAQCASASHCLVVLVAMPAVAGRALAGASLAGLPIRAPALWRSVFAPPGTPPPQATV